MFKKLFQNANKSDISKKENSHTSLHKIVFEIIVADHEIKDSEIQLASGLLEEFFDINKAASITEFENLRNNNHFNADLTKLTTELKKLLTYKERLRIIQICWEILLVDQNEDVLETSTVRKISILLGIEDQDFISIRNTVKKS